jgi:hypothetical protein
MPTKSRQSRDQGERWMYPQQTDPRHPETLRGICFPRRLPESGTSRPRSATEGGCPLTSSRAGRNTFEVALH